MRGSSERANCARVELLTCGGGYLGRMRCLTVVVAVSVAGERPFEYSVRASEQLLYWLDIRYGTGPTRLPLLSFVMGLSFDYLTIFGGFATFFGIFWNRV